MLPDDLEQRTDDRELKKINELRASLALPVSERAKGGDIMFLRLLPIVNPRRANPD